MAESLSGNGTTRSRSAKGDRILATRESGRNGAGSRLGSLQARNRRTSCPPGRG